MPAPQLMSPPHVSTPLQKRPSSQSSAVSQERAGQPSGSVHIVPSAQNVSSGTFVHAPPAQSSTVHATPSSQSVVRRHPASPRPPSPGPPSRPASWLASMPASVPASIGVGPASLPASGDPPSPASEGPASGGGPPPSTRSRMMSCPRTNDSVAIVSATTRPLRSARTVIVTRFASVGPGRIERLCGHSVVSGKLRFSTCPVVSPRMVNSRVSTSIGGVSVLDVTRTRIDVASPQPGSKRPIASAIEARPSASVCVRSVRFISKSRRA